MTVIHTLSTDLVRRGVTPRVYAMQFDGNTRVVEFTLTALGEPWQPPADAAFALSYRKADGTRGLYNQLADGVSAIGVSENKVSVTLAPQVLTAPGIVEAALVLQQGDRRVAAFPFEIHVAEDPSGGKEESDDYFNIQEGSPEAILYTAQALTEAQQTQARANIAAASQKDMDILGLQPIPSKNLFNAAELSDWGQWVNYASGVREYYPDNQYIKDRCTSANIPVQGGKTYTWSGNGYWDGYTHLLSYCVYTESGSFITGQYFNYNGVEPVTITMPPDAGYLVIVFDIIEKPETAMLELGDKATAYEPYGVVGAVMEGVNIRQDRILYDHTSILQLPKQYDLVVGDTFELFYKGVMLCKDPYGYNILVTCDMGNAYSRKYVATPTEAGTHTLTIRVTDDFGNIIDTQSTQLVVSAKMASPGSNIHVLCLGDSLTAGGVWVDELYRRLTQTTSVTQYNAAAPQGDGLGNITFVGKKTTQNGAGYEGIGGWRYSDYLDASKEENPFAYNGSVDFAAYCADLGISKIDRCHILLGWNMAGTAEASWKADAKALIDLLIAHNPAMEIVLLGLQIPSCDGLGTNYGAGGIYAHYRGLQEYVFRVDQWNNALAEAYPGNVSTVSIAGQFDTENNMPAVTAAPNIRSTTQVRQQNNGVHPDIPGYYQIADAVYRQFHRG